MSDTHYRVVVSDRHRGYWTIAETIRQGTELPEDVEIGTSWDSKATAKDICDLMNMAFDAGLETAAGYTKEDVEAIGAMILAGKSLADAIALSKAGAHMTTQFRSGFAAAVGLDNDEAAALECSRVYHPNSPFWDSPSGQECCQMLNQLARAGVVIPTFDRDAAAEFAAACEVQP